MPRSDWETDEDGNVIPENLPVATRPRVRSMADDYPDRLAAAAAVVRNAMAEPRLSVRDLRGVTITDARILSTGRLRLRTPTGRFIIECVGVEGETGVSGRRITCSRISELHGEVLSVYLGGSRATYNRSGRRRYRYTGRRRIKFRVRTSFGETKTIIATLTCEGDRGYDLVCNARMTRAQ